MIISRTPFRISFFGGGSDYPRHYRKHGGAILSTSIDKYCYLTCRYLPPFFEHRYRIVYSKIENVRSADEIQHPAVRGALKYLGISAGLEMHHDSDLPARSGMGSSSAFAVGLLHALHGLLGRIRSKEQLAAEAIHLEQTVLKETVGIQDQIAAAFGGFNRIHIRPDAGFVVEPVCVSAARLKDFSSHLLLFFSGISRTASTIAAELVTQLDAKASSLHRMVAMVDEAMGILLNGSLPDFGLLLNEAWRLKRALSSSVTTTEIDSAYSRAIEAGALGGKLLGAGGGGFLLIFAQPEKHSSVKEALGDLLHVPFALDNTGSQILVYSPDQPE